MKDNEEIEPNDNQLIVWRVRDSDNFPVQCTYEDGKFGYPHRCKLPNGDDDQMFENTHFINEEDAWKKLERSICIQMNMAGRDVQQAEDNLLKFQVRAADMSTRFSKFYEHPKNPNRR